MRVMVGGRSWRSERGYLGAGGWGGRESVNSLDIRCPDLASGGREDGLATKDQLRKHRRGGRTDGDGGRSKRAMGVIEVRGGRREQGEYQWPDSGTYGFLFRLLRAPQLYSCAGGVDRIGEKKCPLILPREISTYA